MQVLIVDDEPLARERLARMLAEIEGVAWVGEAADAEQARAVLTQTLVDVLLLDIQMPGLDGLAFAADLQQSPPAPAADAPALAPAVIFVTAHAEHALAAHASMASGYLLKPVRREELAAAIARAQRPSRAQWRSLQAPAPPAAEPRYISAKIAHGVERIAVADILYFWADQKYTTVYHRHGEHLIDASLQALEDELGEAFLRIHRKALVARAQMRRLRGEGAGRPMLVLWHTEVRLPVSRRRLAEVRAVLEG